MHAPVFNFIFYWPSSTLKALLKTRIWGNVKEYYRAEYLSSLLATEGRGCTKKTVKNFGAS
jgi:hypothetical protein